MSDSFLLLEGNLRVSVARQFGVSISNDFTLLEAIGGNAIDLLRIGEVEIALVQR